MTGTEIYRNRVHLLETLSTFTHIFWFIFQQAEQFFSHIVCIWGEAKFMHVKFSSSSLFKTKLYDISEEKEIGDISPNCHNCLGVHALYRQGKKNENKNQWATRMK